MLSGLSLLSKKNPLKLTVFPARKTTSPRVKIIQTFLIIPLWELKTRCDKRNVKCFPTLLLLSPSRFPCTQLLPLLSLSQEWDPTGYVLRFDYSSSPHPGHFFFFFHSFFLLCKIWLNVCNRTNAHGLTARSSALCVSGICTRHLARSRSPSARALAQNKKGAKCRSASTSLPALRWVRALLSTESPRDAERTCERAATSKPVTTLTTNRSCSFIGEH